MWQFIGLGPCWLSTDSEGERVREGTMEVTVLLEPNPITFAEL